MLEKQESYSRIEVLESGHVQLRKTTTVLDNGEVLSQSHHRSVVTPLDDISDLPDNVQAVCNAFWTDELIANFQSQQNELGKLTHLEYTNDNDKGVVTAHWDCTLLEGEYSARRYGSCSFQPDATSDNYMYLSRT
jgi:hypothetical protein